MFQVYPKKLTIYTINTLSLTSVNNHCHKFEAHVNGMFIIIAGASSARTDLLFCCALNEDYSWTEVKTGHSIKLPDRPVSSTGSQFWRGLRITRMRLFFTLWDITKIHHHIMWDSYCYLSTLAPFWMTTACTRGTVHTFNETYGVNG